MTLPSRAEPSFSLYSAIFPSVLNCSCECNVPLLLVELTDVQCVYHYSLPVFYLTPTTCAPTVIDPHYMCCLNIQVSSGKVLRPTTLGPTGERYRTLASTNSSSGSSPVGGEREEVDNGKFGWLQLQNSAEEEGESSLVEAQKRGHARSTSLDLNKMLQGDGSASGEKVVRGLAGGAR